MLRKVHLYGLLAERFGKTHEFDIQSLRDIPQAMIANYKGFAEVFISGYYQIFLDKKERENQVSESMLDIHLGMTKDIHIIPVPQGAKSTTSKALMMIVAGVALATPFGMAAYAAGGMAAAAATAGTATTMAFTVGLGLASMGVSMLLAPTPKVDNYSSSDDKIGSSTFSGPVNTNSQGLCVPLLYGTFLCSSRVISSSMVTENVAV